MVSSLSSTLLDDDPLAFLLEHSGAEDKYCTFQAGNLLTKFERLNVSLRIYFIFLVHSDDQIELFLTWYA